MEWILYVFEKANHFYLVPDESLDSAWKSLSQRQSCSIENCKKWYKLKGEMNGYNSIWKLKK